MKIYYYNAKIYKKPTKFSFDNDIFLREEKNVLASNEKYMVLDDHYFTRLEINGGGYLNPVLNKQNIGLYMNKGCFNDHVWYSFYSTKKKTPRSIKKVIEKFINKEYSWLVKHIDLGVVK